MSTVTLCTVRIQTLIIIMRWSLDYHGTIIIKYTTSLRIKTLVKLCMLFHCFQRKKNFQWTLCANIQESSDSPLASETTCVTGSDCFCSTYPTENGAEWPHGVKEQTDTGS